MNNGITYNEEYDPNVGTYTIGSDRYAVRIVSRSPSGHRLVCRYWDEGRDTELIFTRRQDNEYRIKGATYYGRLSIGYAQDYRDPSF